MSESRTSSLVRLLPVALIASTSFAATALTIWKAYNAPKSPSIKIKECSSNDELVDHLKNTGVIRSKRVEYAMRKVDRALYCKDFKVNNQQQLVRPYDDVAMPIPCNATISAPHMHAACLEAISEMFEKKEALNILDVGSGSGYVSACLVHMATYNGSTTPFKVYGIDHIPSLVDIAMNSIQSDANTNEYLYKSKLNIVHGDGFEGLPDNAPFDIIHIGAACEGVPQALFEQLAVHGRMVLPLGTSQFYQSLSVVSKNEKSEKLVQPLGIKCRFVPLTDASAQLTSVQTHRTPRSFIANNQKMIVMPFIVSAQDGGDVMDYKTIKWDTADDI